MSQQHNPFEVEDSTSITEMEGLASSSSSAHNLSPMASSLPSPNPVCNDSGDSQELNPFDNAKAVEITRIEVVHSNGKSSSSSSSSSLPSALASSSSSFSPLEPPAYGYIKASAWRHWRNELILLMQFALPSIAISLLGQLMTLVDQMMVGHISATALAAAALGNMCFNTSWYFSYGFACALDTFGSNAYGANDFAGVVIWTKRALFLMIFLTIITGILLSFAYYFLYYVLLQPEDVSIMAQTFCRYLLISLPFYNAYTVLTKFLQVQNILWPSILIGIIANILNVIFNLLFIWTFGLGFIGSPLATSVSRILLFLMLLAYIYINYSSSLTAAILRKRIESRLTSRGWISKVKLLFLKSNCLKKLLETTDDEISPSAKLEEEKKEEERKLAVEEAVEESVEGLLEEDGLMEGETADESNSNVNEDEEKQENAEATIQNRKGKPTHGHAFALELNGEEKEQQELEALTAPAQSDREMIAVNDSEHGRMGMKHYEVESELGIGNGNEEDKDKKEQVNPFDTALTLTLPTNSSVNDGASAADSVAQPADSSSSAASSSSSSSLSSLVSSAPRRAYKFLNRSQRWIRKGFKSARSKVSVSLALYGKDVLDRKGLREFIKLGCAGGGMIFLEGSSFEGLAMIVALINNTNALAAHYIGFSYVAFAFIAFPYGVAIAATIRIGNLMGQGRPQRAHLASRVCLLVGLCFMVCSSIFVLAMGKYIALMYNDDPDVVSRYMTIAPLLAAMEPLDGFNGVSGGICRGLGRQTLALLINLGGFLVIGVTLAAVFCFPANGGLFGVWGGIVIGLLFVDIGYAFAFSKINWDAEADKAAQRVQMTNIQAEQHKIQAENIENQQIEIDTAPKLPTQLSHII